MHSVNDSLKATYYIESKKDLEKIAEFLVEIETTSSWGNKDIPPTKLFNECKGEV